MRILALSGGPAFFRPADETPSTRFVFAPFGRYAQRERILALRADETR